MCIYCYYYVKSQNMQQHIVPASQTFTHEPGCYEIQILPKNNFANKCWQKI